MKLNRLKLGIIAALFIFAGCEKNNSLTDSLNNQTESKLYSVSNNMLVFETPDDYDKLLDQWANADFENILKEQQEAGFTSMYAVYKKNDNLDNLPADDIFFPLILSTDAKIKIGDYTFSFNFKTETLDAQKTDEKTKQSFSFDHEVLPFLFDDEPLVKADYCDGKRRATDVCNKEGWVRYYRAGIYYSLYAQFNVDEAFYGRMECIDKYKWKNKKSSYYTYGDFDIGGKLKKLYYSIYKKRFRLKTYYVEVEFSNQNPNACSIPDAIVINSCE